MAAHCPPISTRWQKIPACFASPDLLPTPGFVAPTRFKGCHGTSIRQSAVDTELARRAFRWKMVSSIRGEPFAFQSAPKGMSHYGVRLFYVDQIKQLTLERNSIQLDGVSTSLSSIHFHIHRWLKSTGLYEQGWRAKSVKAHPGDGRPRIWIAPPQTV